jgi:hypothetical protein
MRYPTAESGLGHRLSIWLTAEPGSDRQSSPAHPPLSPRLRNRRPATSPGSLRRSTRTGSWVAPVGTGNRSCPHALPRLSAARARQAAQRENPFKDAASGGVSGLRDWTVPGIAQAWRCCVSIGLLPPPNPTNLICYQKLPRLSSRASVGSKAMTHTLLHLNAAYRTLAHVDEVTTAPPWRFFITTGCRRRSAEAADAVLAADPPYLSPQGRNQPCRIEQ